VQARTVLGSPELESPSWKGASQTSCQEQCPICAQLRAATLAIVAEDGLEALTSARLAHEAGVSPEKLHAHYQTVQSCLHDTYEQVARSIYQDFAAAFAAEQGWTDALRLAASTLLRRMAARPDEARFCFIEVLRGDHELLRRRDASRRRLIALLVQQLGRECAQPELFATQLELLIGSSFQTIAASIAHREPAHLPALEPELESRAYVFAPAAA
jgi:AcrR family transcriptional regulator